jgi:hypothetical protein
MAASNYDIIIEQGSTWSLTIYLKDKNKLPIDLTGYSAKCQIRKPPPAEDLVLAEPTAVILDPPKNGTLVLKLEADVTSELTFLQGNYDVVLRSGTGEIARLMQGKAKVSPSTTVF